MAVMKKQRTQKAFTLAEVLITLGIIGVVASLTIPTLINNKAKQETVTKLEKVYSTLSQTINAVKNDTGDYNLTPYQNGSGWDAFANEYLKPYLKKGLDCGRFDTSSLCQYSFYKPDGKTIIATWGSNQNKFYLTDGTLIISTGNQSGMLCVYVDLNGSKGPNIQGKDIFIFGFTSEQKLQPWRYNHSRDQNLTSCQTDGAECSALIMQDGWRIADDYPW